MQFADIFSLNSPASWVLWFVVLTLAMYFARLPAHRVILTLTRDLSRAQDWRAGSDAGGRPLGAAQ